MNTEKEKKMETAPSMTAENYVRMWSGGRNHAYDELLRKYKDKVLGHVPYRVNLVDILGADENAHTRILVEILNYERNGEHPFVQSFVSRFMSNMDGANPIQVCSPNVETQRSFIDALIWEESKYSIIIENKINWAVDQDLQIERYIDAASKLCGSEQDCYVIYLTDDGRKKVSNFSLTDRAKKFLGCDDDNLGRYLELNYKEDILPWLKEDVIVNCRYAEKALISMLQQYIDYLEHRFDLGANELERCFSEFLNCNLVEDERERFGQLKSLYNYFAERSNFGPDLKYAVAPFAAQIQNEMTRMVKENYSLDFADAASKKGAAIRDWSRQNGFAPRKWYNSTLFEFLVGPNNERMKFQVDINGENNIVWVQFFNNDFKDDGQHKAVADYGELMDLFYRLFPDVDGNEATKWKVCSRIGEYGSETELLDALNNRVKIFLVAFYKTFK